MLEREKWQHVENSIHCLVHFSYKMENHPLLFERGQWHHVENPIHCLVKQQWQNMEIHPVLNTCALKLQEKLHPLMFEIEQWQHVGNSIHCLLHYSNKMENHPLLFERGQWHVENDIHCLVKQQWWHMEIHLVPTKCALKAYEKLHPLMFARELWQHVENPMHCLVHNSDNIWNTFHCLLNVLWKHAENQIHCFLRECSDNMWRITHTA